MRPGVPIMQLHGRMKQYQRNEIFNEFCNAEKGKT